MLFTILYKVLSFGIDKYTSYKAATASNEVELAKIEADVNKNKDTLRASLLANGGWWFQLFFVWPLAVWFMSVVLYSIFWCKACMFPQPWSIAALPSPLDQWAGWIVMFLFLVTPTGKR